MAKACRRDASVRPVGLALGLLVGMTLLLWGVTSPVQAAPCGPGPHWVDTCAAGSDHFAGWLKLWVDLNLDNISDIELRVKGPVWIDRSDPIPGNDPNDPSHLSKINTEIVSLSAAGFDPVLGNFTIMAGSAMGLPPSLGMIIEKTGPGTPDCDFPADPTMACSFFDVFHKIQTDQITLINLVPIRVEAMIDRVPPFADPDSDCAVPNVYCFEGVVPLVDAQNPTGPPVAQIIHVVHIPEIPEPSTLLLLGSGMAGLIGLEMRRRKLAKKA